MARHIGLVVGSGEMAALCYRLICSGSADLMGEMNHPEISTHAWPLARYFESVAARDWESVASLLLESARKLAGAGADFLICPDNTLHRSYDLIAEASPLPWVHIAAPVRDKAVERGLSRLGIIGSKPLLEGSVFTNFLAPEGIEVAIPEKQDIDFMGKIIHDELVYGISTTESRRYFESVIRGMKDDGCDGVIMASDASILMDGMDFNLPVLDSIRLLAEAAIHEALR